jgi:hypothetical protein
MSAFTTVTTKFYPVKVTVVRDDSGKHHVGCEPKDITVDRENSVVSYQLVSAPEGVVFWGAAITPHGQTQFKSPQITAEGRMMSFDDIDNDMIEASFNLTLQFTGADGVQFDYDPQIINRPY